MKEELRVRLVDFLQTAQQIIEGDGETSFEGCRKRRRQEIVRMFMETFAHDTDGDCDGCEMRMTEGGDEVALAFAAKCDDFADVPNEASRMYIYVYPISGGDIETIPEAIEYLESIRGEGSLPLALLNTSILTATGEYTLHDIDVDTAKQLVNSYKGNLDSAIGHASTAQIMSTILGVDIPVNRQVFEHKPGQQALVFRLNGRCPEGKILSAEEIEEMGYKFQLLSRMDI